MSSSDLPKLWTEPTKIGHIFRNQSWSPGLIFFTEKKSERFSWFLMLKSDFKSTNFAISEEVFHNFGRSYDDMKVSWWKKFHLNQIFAYLKLRIQKYLVIFWQNLVILSIVKSASLIAKCIITRKLTPHPNL